MLGTLPNKEISCKITYHKFHIRKWPVILASPILNLRYILENMTVISINIFRLGAVWPNNVVQGNRLGRSTENTEKICVASKFQSVHCVKACLHVYLHLSVNEMKIKSYNSLSGVLFLASQNKLINFEFSEKMY